MTNDKLFYRARLTDQEIKEAYLWNPNIKPGELHAETVLRAVADAATEKAINEAKKEV